MKYTANTEKIIEKFGFDELGFEVEDIIEELNDYTVDFYDALYEEVDRRTIYNYKSWEIIEFYFSPNEDNISLSQAIELFIDDIVECTNFNEKEK